MSAPVLTKPQSHRDTELATHRRAAFGGFAQTERCERKQPGLTRLRSRRSA